MNILFIAQWLFGGNSEVLHCPDGLTRRQKLFKQENNFKQTHVIFLPRKYDVISHLRHSYAKGPFCVARLNYTFDKTAGFKNLFFLTITLEHIQVPKRKGTRYPTE